MLWSQLGVSGPAGSQSTTQPTRNTSEQQLDQWNQAFRQSSLYQSFMRANGLPTDGRVRLSRAQQDSLERAMAQAGIKVPSGMHIDQGGNLNQSNHLVRNSLITAGIAGAALATAGAAGAFSGPAAGGSAAGGAGGAAAGAGAAEGAGWAGAGTLAGDIAGIDATVSGLAGTVPGAVGVGGMTAAGAVPGIAGSAASAAGGFPWSTVLKYAIPSVASVVQGYLGSNAAKDAAEIQNQAAQKGIDTINSLIPAERARQDSIYGGVRGDLSSLYNQTAQTQGNLYNSAGQSQANLYNATGQAQNQVYNQTAAAYQPYQQLGAGSLSNLSRMIGGGPIAAAPSFQPVGFQPVSFSPVSAPQFSASTGQTGNTGINPNPNVAQNAPVNNTTAPPAQNLEAPTGTSAPTTTSAPTPQAQAAMQTATSYAPGRLNSMASGPVRLRAPTGETMDFAPNDPNIQRALDQGAQRVA